MSWQCTTPRGAWEWYHITHSREPDRMIIDSHAYCFRAPPTAHAGTLPGRSISAGCRRRRRAIISPRSACVTALKARPKFSIRTRENLDGLPDVNFRIDRASGRVLWDYRGETYTKHFYPPNLRNLEFTPDSLIGEMDYAGIDKVLLHTNAMLGRSNDYQAECVAQYPDRILSMALIDERVIHSDVDAVIDGVTTAIRDLGLHAIKFGSAGYTVSDEPWVGGPYAPFWEARLDTWSASLLHAEHRARPGERSASRRLRTGELYRRAPHTHAPHGALPRHVVQHHARLPLARLHGRRPHHVARRDMGAVREPEPEPGKSASPSASAMSTTIRTARCGRRWRRWSSESAHSNSCTAQTCRSRTAFCTYRQSRDWLERHFAPATGLSDDDLALIMGGTAARLLGVGDG